MSNFKVRHAYLSILTTKIGILHENLCTLCEARTQAWEETKLFESKRPWHTQTEETSIVDACPNDTTELTHTFIFLN